ncbi:MAG TPA: cell surface protein SprA [Saprospiraceae bacterium]|nr:cell surface protein SprA [Saprospiraceae bacterium]HMV22959.1 cell surface protein SprA [Saprospiraceae bacterium]HMX82116.1 cell surface protein SprA [Saprospiraceae bacterium]HMX84772.1 cell surface protein SprA [Saprospiraceae bacterium]HMZ72629.1 cell surface protein SprA [Saprospiraceae bacterium]
MNYKQLIISFLLTVLVGVFSFAMLNLPQIPRVAYHHPAGSTSSEVTDTIPEKKTEYPLYKPKTLIDLKDPASVEKSEEYDPASGQYILSEKIGNEYYKAPVKMSFDEYLNYKSKQQEREYFDYLSGVSKSSGKKYDPKNPLARYIPNKSLLNRLFGGTEPVINPTGNIDLTFGYDYSKVENPTYPIRNQTTGGFDFDMNIQMNVTGKIGEKLNLSTQFNNRATFDFENQMKIDYNSTKFNEDEIIRSIEAGNVSLPLKSSLIKGNNSLFGVKTELQFGNLRLTAVASQQKSRRKAIELKGGKELQTFAVKADEYDENRHFFLSHYNRNNFERSLENLPQINSLFRLNKIEVWVTNDRNVTEKVRDIVAITDLGESERITNSNPQFQKPAGIRNPDIYGKELPANSSNDIYESLITRPDVKTINKAVATLTGPEYKFSQIRDFEKVRARLLNDNEYTINNELGIISMNINMKPSDVLGVAYEYTYNGKTFRVGQLSTENPNNPDTLGVLFVKMLKSTTSRVDLPMWDLMAKNFYSIGAYNVEQEDFKLDIYYEDPGGGEKRFLPSSNLAGEPLIQLFNLDKLNKRNDPFPDGIFDFVPGLTVNTRSGRIMFPVLEPFGSYLGDKIDNANLRKKYGYYQLYDSTVTQAREFPELNRFTLKGSFKAGTTSDISLGVFNLPQGSVTVTAGGVTLTPNVDYSVDYNTGRVKILNDSYLQSGVPINISFEDNSLFSFQTRTMLGLRADYKLGKDINVGGTFLNLFERPFTQKVNIGEDPINNKIYGADITLKKDLPWLTKAIDKIPLIQTKEMSAINFSAEAAALKPGHASAVNESAEKGGNVYVDDFEGSTNGFDIRQPATNWVLASVPQMAGNDKKELFPESSLIDDLRSGVNRAKLAWYRIDETVRATSAGADNNYVTAIPIKELFPNRQIPTGYNTNIQTFDLHYEPTVKGPYNFDLPLGTTYSKGIEKNASLKEPATRWGGIMRNLQNNNDFEAANYEYIEFWLLSPFIDNSANPGDLYINIGNVSEDILRDSRLFSENALPNVKNPNLKVDRTVWSNVPRIPPINNSFDADPEVRKQQDIGLDGANDDDERVKFADILNQYQGYLTPEAMNEAMKDPSNDNFISFQDPVWNSSSTVYDRYSRYNGTEGNNQPAKDGLINSSTQNPDSEDVILDNTLNEAESYFEYKIPLVPDGNVGIENNPYVVEKIDGPAGSNRTWYRFVVPIQEYSRKVGGIQDFRSIRFIRMYLTGFNQEVTLRFATLELIRSQWRRYKRPFSSVIEVDPDNKTSFDVKSVSIEENSQKLPFNYVTPPGIIRENTLSNAQSLLQNEQSIAINVCNLKPGDSRAIYKLSGMDLRVFERMKMFVHAESQEKIAPGGLSVFLRMGSDFQNNYYEYEIPIELSDPDNTYTPGTPEYEAEVWRKANNLDILLKLFKEAKQERNKSGISLIDVFEMADPDFPSNKVRVIGNPNLGLVKGFMVGVKNNDKIPHCAELWVNELRVNGFDENSGYAALARAEVKLADLGRVNVAGNFTSIGWGNLEQRLAERQREQVVQYDGAVELELSKFLPPNTGLKIPFLAQVSNTTRTPEYDPYDLDIPLKEKLDNIDDKNVRDSVRSSAEDYTNIKGFNFTNVRKERTGTAVKPKPWDVENFAASYAYTQTDHHDPIISSDRIKNYKGALDYNFTRQVKYVEPLKKVLKDAAWLKLLSDFNFNPIPNGFVLRNAMDRTLQATSYRFAGTDPTKNTFYDKRWSWDRNYSLNWDLTRSLKLTFSANNQSLIDERPENTINPETNVFYTDAEKSKYIKDNLKKFGRTKTYSHNIGVNYTLPTKGLLITDWTTIRANVNSSYSWNTASLNTDSLGNVIQNTQQRQLNADLDFEALYNKIKYLKKINKKEAPKRSVDARGVMKDPGKPEEKKNAKDPDLKDTKTDKKDKKDREPSIIEKIVIRPLMMVRKGRLTYSESYTNVVPGFTPKTNLLGMNQGFTAPGLPFILGERPTDRWFDESADKGWFTESVFLNQPVSRNYTRDISGQIKLEPFNDFKLDVDLKQNYALSRQEDFKKPSVTEDFQHLSVREVGSYTISYLAINTLFDKNVNGLFKKFEDNREIISQRLGTGKHVTDYLYGNYTEGYGRYQQEVLVPAFIAAYSGDNPSKVVLNEKLFSKLPLPNWKLSYGGLNKLPLLKDIFSSVNITHGYTSTLTISNFNTNAFYNPNDPLENLQPITNNYFSRYEIPAIVITEQLSPLLGVDVKLKNDMSARVDMKKSRNLQMSFVDNTLFETNTTEYVFGFGYRIKNIDIPFLVKKAPVKKKTDDKKLPSSKKGTTNTGRDLNIKVDFSYRDDLTTNHLLDQDISNPTRGSTTIRITPNADYQLNKRLNLRLFWEYSRILPKTTESFPTTNTSAGITVRFSLK